MLWLKCNVGLLSNTVSVTIYIILRNSALSSECIASSVQGAYRVVCIESSLHIHRIAIESRVVRPVPSLEQRIYNQQQRLQTFLRSAACWVFSSLDSIAKVSRIARLPHIGILIPCKIITSTRFHKVTIIRNYRGLRRIVH